MLNVNVTTAVASVGLSEPLQKMYQMHCSCPHVSVLKSRDSRWRDLGDLVRRAESALDWTASGLDGVQYSPTVMVSRIPLFWTVTVIGAVKMQQEG